MTIPKVKDSDQKKLDENENENENDNSSSELSFIGSDETTICEHYYPLPTTKKGVNPRIHHWRRFIHDIFRTVIQLNLDLNTWKWFMIPKYKGDQDINTFVQPWEIKIYGGPKYTGEIYQQMKERVGKEILKLQFLVFSKFRDQNFVTIFWTISKNMIRVYDVLIEDLKLFYTDVDAAKRVSLSGQNCSLKGVVTWQYCQELTNGSIEQDSEKSYKTGRVIVSGNKPTTEELKVVDTWSDINVMPILL